MLPPELQEEFEQVGFADGMGNERQLFKLVVCERCLKYEFEKIKKNVVDLATERVPIHPGNIR